MKLKEKKLKSLFVEHICPQNSCKIDKFSIHNIKSKACVN